MVSGARRDVITLARLEIPMNIAKVLLLASLVLGGAPCLASDDDNSSSTKSQPSSSSQNDNSHSSNSGSSASSGSQSQTQQPSSQDDQSNGLRQDLSLPHEPTTKAAVAGVRD